MKILSSILLVAAAANAGTALAPRGKTRRAVVFAVSLATLLALLLPILSALGELPDLPESLFPENRIDAAGNPATSVTEAAEAALSHEISRRFGSASRAVLITLPGGADDPGRIRITLAPRDAGMKEMIAAWLESESDAAVEIEIEGENSE